MKKFNELLEDIYASQYKVKKDQVQDPETGEWKWHDRKVRVKRIEFKNSGLGGKPAQDTEQENNMNEATVKPQKYSWGTMKTIHHGADFSIPLHPEHHEAIAKLKDEQEHNFKDETGRSWTARRKGDDVHFQGANGGNSTVVKHSTMTEATIAGTPGWKKIKQNIKDKSGAIHTPMSRARDLARKAIKTVRENTLDEVLSKSADAAEWIHDFVHSDNPKFAGKSKEKRKQMALAAYYSKQRNEEVESIEELNKSTLGSYVKKASVDSTISRKIATDFEHRAKKARKQDMRDANTNVSNQFKDKSWKRQDNINKAVDRLTKEEVELEEGDLSIRTLYNKFADAHVGGQDTKPTEKAIKKVHGDKVFAHMKKAANSNAKGDFDGEERHFDNAQTAGRKTDRIGSTVGRGRSEFRKQFEEVELQEANHRDFASVGKMHPDMAKHMEVGNEMDFYAHGTGDKMSGKVLHNNGKEVHIKTTHNPYKEKDTSVHKFKVSSKLEEGKMKDIVINKQEDKLVGKSPAKNTDISDKSYLKNKPGIKSDLKNFGRFLAGKKETNEEVELDEATSPTAGTRLVKKYGSDEHRSEVRYNPEWQEYQVHHYKDGKHMGEGPVSYHGDDKQDAHDTAKSQAEKRMVKEEKEEDGHMAKIDLATIVNHIKRLEPMLDQNIDLPDWVESKITIAADYIGTVADYMEVCQQVHEEKQYAGLEKEKKPGLPTAMIKKSEKAVEGDTVEGWDHPHKAVRKEEFESGEVETRTLSYKDFMESITFTKTGLIHKGTRGYGNQPEEQEDDEDDNKKKKAVKTEPAVKRGRGRPAGAKSGANQKVSGGKSGNGADYTGYKLHLPNANKY